MRVVSDVTMHLHKWRKKPYKLVNCIHNSFILQNEQTFTFKLMYGLLYIKHNARKNQLSDEKTLPFSSRTPEKYYFVLVTFDLFWFCLYY